MLQVKEKQQFDIMESVDRRSDWSGMMFEAGPLRILPDRLGRPEQAQTAHNDSLNGISLQW
jgi:hypothetical protein